MSILSIDLPYGQTNAGLLLKRSEVTEVLYYPAYAAEGISSGELAASIACPYGTPLRQLAQGKKRAAVVVSDRSRLCPTCKILPVLLKELLSAGMTPGQIQIIAALGMHRKMTKSELAQLVGSDIYREYRVRNHSCLPEDCISLGTTSRGTPVEINRIVAEADLRIAVGSPEPHGLAGVSGGVKALLPGVASSRAIEHNHALSAAQKIEPGNPQNPVHEDMAEAHRLLPFHYVCNVITNHRRAIIEVLAGAPEQVQARIPEAVRRHFTLDSLQPADLVVASAGGYPKDIHLYQAIKSLQNAAKTAKPDAPILLLAECPEGYGNGILQHWMETIQEPSAMIRKLDARFVLGAHKIGHLHPILTRHPVYLLSGLPEHAVTLCGFHPVRRLQEQVDRLSGPAGRILVLPHASLTFPASNGTL